MVDAEAESIRIEAGMALEAVLALEAVVDAFQRLGSLETVEDTWPRLKSTERTNMGNSEATEPVGSEVGVAL